MTHDVVCTIETDSPEVVINFIAFSSSSFFFCIGMKRSEKAEGSQPPPHCSAGLVGVLEEPFHKFS